MLLELKQAGVRRTARITDALARFLSRADKAGGCHGLLVMGQPADGGRPILEIHGNWREDPVRLIGELTILKDKLARMALEERGGPTLQGLGRK